MLTARARDLDIAYEEAGSGDPVFFVNGTGESAFSWRGTVEVLAARWRCVAIDQRDTGGSPRTETAYTPFELALDAAAVIDALALGPCHVVGFSLGGAVGQELALARPDLVRSLVLLSTWHRSDPWFISQMRQWQVLRRAHGDDTHAFDVSLAPWMFSPATMADARAYERILSMWDAAPDQEAEAFCRQCDADIAHDAAARLGSIEVPALVVVGEDDICTPPRYARALASSLPDVRLMTVEDAGHCAVFERPGAVVATIESFLRGA